MSPVSPLSSPPLLSLSLPISLFFSPLLPLLSSPLPLSPLIGAFTKVVGTLHIGSISNIESSECTCTICSVPPLICPATL